MANEKTLNALKKIATFGTSLAAESAYNEYKTEKDTERLENSFNQLHPEVMKRTNTNPAKMAAAYNVHGQTRVTSNLDATMRTAIDTATNYASLDPGSYNKKLAEDLLPSVNAIKSLKGAERSAAISRFENQVQVAQAQQMTANKKYTQTLARNGAANNINVLLDTYNTDTRDMTLDEIVELYDGQLAQMLSVARDNGLSDLDSQKLVDDVFRGRVAEGNIKIQKYVDKSRFRAFVNPMSLRLAKSQGKQAMLDRDKAATDSKQLSKDKQEALVNQRIKSHMQTGQSITSLITQDQQFVNGMSDTLYNKIFLSGAGNVNLTNDPSRDPAILKQREQLTQVIAAELSTGKDPQVLKNRLNDKTAHLGVIIDAIDRGETKPWDEYDYNRKVKIYKDSNKPKYERINSGIASVKAIMADRVKNYGTDSLLQRASNRAVDAWRWATLGDDYIQNVADYDNNLLIRITKKIK